MPTPHNLSVLVINSGSSSVKFTLFGIEDEAGLVLGIDERIRQGVHELSKELCFGS